MREKSWLTENNVPSVKSLGDATSGSYSNTWRLSLGKATRDWRQEHRAHPRKHQEVAHSRCSELWEGRRLAQGHLHTHLEMGQHLLLPPAHFANLDLDLGAEGPQSGLVPPRGWSHHPCSLVQGSMDVSSPRECAAARHREAPWPVSGSQS